MSCVNNVSDMLAPFYPVLFKAVLMRNYGGLGVWGFKDMGDLGLGVQVFGPRSFWGSRSLESEIGHKLSLVRV